MGPARGDSADSEMWVVMSSDGVLFVEVVDDRLVPSAKSWVKADHLELWTTEKDSNPSSGCLQPDPDAMALQWGIGLGGEVYKGHGAPADNPTVRVARTERGARFRIVLPKEGPGLTVVYSDSDDGVQAKRHIATSQLVPGKWWTLGTWYDPFADPFVELKIQRPAVACEITSTKLSPRSPAIPSTPE